ncbi:MAG: 4Fe-4S binding protein [Bacteroidales bacterium]|nr:4Fe-4S binding protein [Bacteroidales bacterium]
MAKVKGAVEVDVNRCKGCELCVFACPSKVLALSQSVNDKGYAYAYMKQPELCIGCASCAYMCPDGCIKVYKTKE